MLSLTRKQATAAPGGGPNAGAQTALADDGAPTASVALGQHVQAFDRPIQAGETRRSHSRRMARRTRLHGYAVLAVALSAFVIALAAANTAHVKISWLFGTSHVSLVWLILAAAIIGWLLGLVTNAALHRSTRAPRPASRPRS
jgi:uncharacterized integral membrane protein